MNLTEFFRTIFKRRSNRAHSARAYLERHRSFWRRNSIYTDNIYNKIATDVAMGSFKHVRITRNPNAPDGMDVIDSDLMQVLTLSPNSLETPVVFWANVVRKMLREGVAVVVPRYENAQMVELFLADNITSWTHETITVRIEDTETEIPVGLLLVFENPKQNVTAQLSQITNLIDDNLNALSSKINEQNSTLKGFIKSPTVIADETMAKQHEERVQSMMEAAQTGGISYLSKGEEFQELSNTYETASESELEFLKSQLYHAFGLNESLFTGNYTEEQYRAYHQSVLLVYQRVISEEINRKYFTKTARTQGHKLLVFYDMTGLTSLKDLSEFTFKAKYSGLMNSNELREQFFGLPAYPGGEVFETNTNAVRVGQAQE